MRQHAPPTTVPREPAYLPPLPHAAGGTDRRRYDLLRRDPRRPAPEEGKEPRTRTVHRNAKGCYLLCSLCGHRITHTGEGIPVQGSHRHTFANPHGYVFRIGCFRSAPGCRPASAETADFSWFPGYAWRIQVCGNCFAHLGWDFRTEQHAFHGLILERLTEERRDRAPE